MQPRRLMVFALSLLCLACLGASCDGTKPPEQAPTQQSADGASAASEGEQVTSLPAVDVSDLTDAEKALWISQVNTRLSPCGDPVPVGRCAQSGGCRACVPAARYLVRLIADGEDDSSIADMYAARFGKAGKLDVSVGSSAVRGAPMAPVTIVEFSDFQCPYCGRAHPQLSRALAQLDGKVKLVFKHYPLSMHKRAVPAALAAEAAREQGKFWEMHDLLFEHQDKLEDPHLLAYAEQLGLDTTKFKRDMASETIKARVEADREAGRKLGISSTPTLIVNGRKFEESITNLLPYLREELER